MRSVQLVHLSAVRPISVHAYAWAVDVPKVRQRVWPCSHGMPAMQPSSGGHMRTYSSPAPLSEAAKRILADKRAGLKVLMAVASGRLPIEVEANGVRYVVSGAQPLTTSGVQS